MGSLLTRLISCIIPGWTRREATLTTHSEGRPAARAWGTVQHPQELLGEIRMGSLLTRLISCNYFNYCFVSRKERFIKKLHKIFFYCIIKLLYFHKIQARM